MDTKHTPGPWRQDGLYIDQFDPSHPDGRGTLIATIHSEDSIENQANGLLIAAAPDGLQAAIDALQAADEMGIECPGADGLRAFIAKATNTN